MRPARVMRLRRPAAPPADDLVLLRAVCHELAPPVSTIGALLREIGRQPAGQRRDDMLRLAVEHAGHAEAVLRQASVTSHPRADEVPLHRVLPTSLATVPADRLTVSVHPGAARCLVHPHHVRQILANLLDNAVRHGPPGGPVRLWARARGRTLRLVVADAGAPTAGLADALRRDTPPPDAKGLGLWLVRHLVATHGGTLRARRAAPRGLALEVRLPRRTG